MKGLSKKEIQVVSDLEFRDQYYFTRTQIRSHFKNDKQMTNTLYRLRKKGRIEKLSKNKYYLIPIKAPNSKWLDHPFIIVDEMFNGENYFIGGWSAANHWQVTEQIPMRVDVYTTTRQGRTQLFNTRFVFHRSTKQRVQKAIVQTIEGHSFRIVPKKVAQKWVKYRQ